MNGILKRLRSSVAGSEQILARHGAVHPASLNDRAAAKFLSAVALRRQGWADRAMFGTSDVLVLTGDAEVGLDEDGHVQSAEIGAERLWRIRPRQGHWLRGALLLAFQLKRWSPDTLATGDWRKRVEKSSFAYRRLSDRNHR